MNNLSDEEIREGYKRIVELAEKGDLECIETLRIFHANLVIAKHLLESNKQGNAS